jgi:hypothetical protein
MNNMRRLALAMVILIALAPMIINQPLEAGINDIMEKHDQITLLYLYNYDMVVEQLYGKLAVFNVKYLLRVEIENYNTSHIRVRGIKIGNISTTFESPDPRGLAVLILWFGSNVTRNTNMFVIPDFDLLINKGDFYKLSSVTRVDLIRNVGGGCTTATVADGIKAVGKYYSVGESGEALYDCIYGIMIKYTNTTTSLVNLPGQGSATYLKLKFDMVLVDSSIVNELFITETVPTNPLENPVNLALIAGTVALILAAIAIVLKFLKIRKRSG